MSLSEAYLVEGDRRYPLAGETTVGRGEGADLRFAHPQVSRVHACIRRTERGYFLEDLESRFGTSRNGEPVCAAIRLANGDELVLGGTLTLRFYDPAETGDCEHPGDRPLWVDPHNGDVFVRGHRLDPPLSAAQMGLLQLLMGGRLVSRPELIAAIWPDEVPEGISEEAVDGLIKRLRARLRQHGPDLLEIVRGRGLRLRL